MTATTSTVMHKLNPENEEGRSDPDRASLVIGEHLPRLIKETLQKTARTSV